MYSSVSIRIFPPWSAASRAKRLTPRGGPRRRGVVGAAMYPDAQRVRRVLELEGRESALMVTPCHSAGCRHGGSWLAGVRTALCAGPHRRVDRGKRGNGGVSDPPCFRLRSPRGRPRRVAHAPVPSREWCRKRRAFAPVQHVRSQLRSVTKSARHARANARAYATRFHHRTEGL